ncbi:MAG: helix-turn-helix domain-containing protein [Chloroflexi bacterium]|nr:helix-turn-helix domain-containing protein [Chloroflexota bacterium]
MKEEEQEYVSTNYAARFLGVSQESISQNIRKGNIPAIRIGRNWAVHRETWRCSLGHTSKVRVHAKGESHETGSTLRQS